MPGPYSLETIRMMRADERKYKDLVEKLAGEIRHFLKTVRSTEPSTAIPSHRTATDEALLKVLNEIWGRGDWRIGGDTWD